MRILIIFLLGSVLCFPAEDFYGKEFIFAIPRNDDKSIDNNSHTNHTIELIVSGFEDANIKLYRNEILLEEYFIPKGSSESIRNEDFRNNEIVDFGLGTYQKENCYKIESDGEISVILVNYFEYSSEGTSLIPTDSWGKEYSHISYWNDSQDKFTRNTGFIIIASEDDTEVTVKLNGRTRGNYLINQQYKLGDSIKIKLDKNMIYNVEATGDNISIDITGSLIKSDKDIAVISYHHRTGIHSELSPGKDNLMEMFPPLNTWGKNFVTSAFKRSNKGDYFRIVSGNQNTSVTFTSYDKSTLEILENDVVELAPNSFYEVTSRSIGIRGITIWKSNNPILVSQSSFSAQFDNESTFDPNMVYIVPVEQFSSDISFKIPLNEYFSKNRFNIIINNNSGEEGDLDKLIYNSTPITELDPEIFNKRIPQTNYYFTTIEINDTTSSSINGVSEFYAVLYGNELFDSYALTLGGHFKNLQKLDSTPPTITYNQDCKYFSIEFEESNLNELGLDSTDYYQSGLSKNEILSIENFELIYSNRKNIELEVQDLEKEAQVILSVEDIAGNSVVDTIIYLPNISYLNLKPIFDNKIYTPGENFQLSFKIEDFEDNIDVDSMFLEFKHPAKALYLYENKYISKKTKNDTSYYKLNLTDLIDGKIDFITLDFETLIWEDYEFLLDFNNEEIQNCLKININDFTLSYNSCIYEYRQVDGSFFSNQLKTIVNENGLFVEFESPYLQTVSVQIIDLLGNKIYDKNFDVYEGGNKFILDSLILEKGIYFIRLDTETETIFGKFIY
jgi:hypothetical protein